MHTGNTYAVYFSPALSTRQVVMEVASGIATDVIRCDITLGFSEPLALSPNDCVVIGVPAYSGRVPTLAKAHLTTLEGNGAAAVLVCSYGNRDYDDTLIELRNLCISRGFRVISAGALVARHSIFPTLAQGRPGEADLAAARNFGRACSPLTQLEPNTPLAVKGNTPYRAIKSVPLAPKANATCNACGLCAAQCPAGAINKEAPRKTNKKHCIACSRCIVICPQKARRFTGILYKIAGRQFVKKHRAPKENEFFFAK